MCLCVRAREWAKKRAERERSCVVDADCVLALLELENGLPAANAAAADAAAADAAAEQL